MAHQHRPVGRRFDSRRPLGPRQSAALAAERAKGGIDQSRRARLPRSTRQLDGVVDRRGRRNAIEIEQLEGAEPKHAQHLGVEPLERTRHAVRQLVVDRALHAKRAGDQLEQAAIDLGHRPASARSRAIASPRSVPWSAISDNASNAARRAAAIIGRIEPATGSRLANDHGNRQSSERSQRSADGNASIALTGVESIAGASTRPPARRVRSSRVCLRVGAGESRAVDDRRRRRRGLRRGGVRSVPGSADDGASLRDPRAPDDDPHTVENA